MTIRRLASKGSWLPLVVLALTAAAGGTRAQYGTILSGAGAVNRSMGGASTAAPLSPAGTLFWNPATMNGLPRSEIELGVELFFPHTSVASTVKAGAFGPGIPPVGLSGVTNSDSGVFPLPTRASSTSRTTPV